MIRNAYALTALATLALMAGCSTMSVKHDYDSDVDFAQYRSFAWIAKPEVAATNAAEAQQNSDLLDRRVRAAVEGELAARGLAQVDVDPGLLVVYHLGVQDKIQVTDYGYSYSPYTRGYGGRQLDVNQYQEGTLIIDLVDAKTKNLVWRGTGTKVIESSPRTPQEMQARIDDVVGKVMASYPPQ